jgi:hypothetical protein
MLSVDLTGNPMRFSPGTAARILSQYECKDKRGLLVQYDVKTMVSGHPLTSRYLAIEPDSRIE